MISGTSDASRSELWREWLAGRFAGLSSAPAKGHDGEVVGRVRSVNLGDVDVYRVAGSTQTLDRRASVVRSHPSEALKMCLITHGSAVIEQSAVEVGIGRANSRCTTPPAPTA